MKKILLLVAIAAISILHSQAQEISPNALGIRLGAGTGELNSFDVEFSYQKALGFQNRAEIDLGINSGDGYNGFKLSGYYQWVWHLEGSFNWYAAPGVQLGFVSVKHGDDYFLLGIGGQVGIEYCFKDIPLHLTLDYNPTIGLTNSTGYYGPFALGVRYLF